MNNTTNTAAASGAATIMRFNNLVGLMNPDRRGLYVRYEDHVAALAAPAQAASGAPSESISDVQRQAFIKGWDHRGMAHELKGNVETDDRMRVLMSVFYPRADAAPVTAAPAQAGEYPAGTGNPEADRIICRLASSDPDFDDCADAVALIHKLVAEIKGPDGFDTWKDAAIADRAARGSAQAAPAGVLEDAARWHWMAEYIVGTRTELDDELIASATVDELSKLVDADLAAQQGDKP